MRRTTAATTLTRLLGRLTEHVSEIKTKTTETKVAKVDPNGLATAAAHTTPSVLLTDKMSVYDDLVPLKSGDEMIGAE